MFCWKLGEKFATNTATTQPTEHIQCPWHWNLLQSIWDCTTVNKQHKHWHPSDMPLWLYRYEIFSTHTTHAHATLLSRVHTLSRRSPAARTQLASHTDSLCPTLSWPLHLPLCLDVYMTAVCVGDAISWLSGWASLWHPPHRLTKSTILSIFGPKGLRFVQQNERTTWREKIPCQWWPGERLSAILWQYPKDLKTCMLLLSGNYQTDGKSEQTLVGSMSKRYNVISCQSPVRGL